MSRPSSTDEKASATLESNGGVRRSMTANDVNGENPEVVVAEVKASEPEVPPASFSSLFRYVVRSRRAACLLIRPQFFNQARIVHGLHWLDRCSCVWCSPGICKVIHTFTHPHLFFSLL